MPCRSSREAATQESPARQWREGKVNKPESRQGRHRVSFTLHSSTFGVVRCISARSARKPLIPHLDSRRPPPNAANTGFDLLRFPTKHC